MSPSTKAVGFWSAVAATVFALAYDVGQIAEWLGWLGSAGGPESVSTPLGIVVLLVPSFFLAPAFVLMLAALDTATPPQRLIWSRSALAFACVYAVMICINYFVQLTYVGPHLARNDAASVGPFVFTPFDSFLYAVDILGYSFMCLAMVLAAFVFEKAGLERRLRWFMLANAPVIPMLLLQNYWHWMIWIASIWAVSFPASTWTLALWFKRSEASAQ